MVAAARRAVQRRCDVSLVNIVEMLFGRACEGEGMGLDCEATFVEKVVRTPLRTRDPLLVETGDTSPCREYPRHDL